MPRQDGFFIFYTKAHTFIKCNGGQATFEYFVLFVIISFFCLFSLNGEFFNNIRDSLTDVYQQAAESLK